MRWLTVALMLITVSAVQAEDDLRRLKDVSYGPHGRNKLDITIPPSKTALPLVIWVHGGGWMAGDKSRGNPAEVLIAKGYAVASINYRFSQHAIYPAQLHDCQRAIRFLRTHAAEYNIDPNRVGVWGASAGGHLVALLGTTAGVKELDGEPDSMVSARVQAVCDWFGPTDLMALVPPDDAGNVVAKLVGGPLGQQKAIARLADPVRYLDKLDAPMLIIHGTKDPLVPLSQSRYLHDAAKKVGVESQLMVLEGAGHGDGVFRTKLMDHANRDTTIAFFAKHLQPKSATD